MLLCSVEVFVVAFPAVDIACDDHRILAGDFAVTVDIRSGEIELDILPAVDIGQAA